MRTAWWNQEPRTARSCSTPRSIRRVGATSIYLLLLGGGPPLAARRWRNPGVDPLVRALILELLQRRVQRSAVEGSFVSIIESVPGSVETSADSSEQLVHCPT